MHIILSSLVTLRRRLAKLLWVRRILLQVPRFSFV